MEGYIVCVIFILTMTIIIVLSYFKKKNVEKKINNIIKEYNFTQKGFNIINDINSFKKKFDKGRHVILITNNKNGYITINVAIEFKTSTKIKLQSFFEKIKFNAKIAKNKNLIKLSFLNKDELCY